MCYFNKFSNEDHYGLSFFGPSRNRAVIHGSVIDVMDTLFPHTHHLGCSNVSKLPRVENNNESGVTEFSWQECFTHIQYFSWLHIPKLK